MAEAPPKRRPRFAWNYIIGAALCMMTVWCALRGFEWYGCVIVFCGAILIVVGGRRLIFRVGVRRLGDEIVCRYLPLYESTTYFGTVLLPGFGVAAVAGGSAPGNPVWWRFGGFLLFGVSALTVVSSILMWRRNLLRITPSILRVRVFVIGTGAGARALKVIPRELITAIEPKWVQDAFGIQVEIAYRVAGRDDTINTVRLGRHVSVQPMNLLYALRTWKDGQDDDPSALLDRVERILRDRSMADA